MNCFINEFNGQLVKKQQQLLERLQSGLLNTLDDLQQFKRDYLAELDHTKCLTDICQNVSDAHLANIEQHKDEIPVIKMIHTLRSVLEAGDSVKTLVFGYCRQQIEVDLAYEIPEGMKSLCLMYHGRFAMNSNILDANDVNNIGRVLCSLLQRKSLLFNKLYDTEIDGWDAAKLNQVAKDNEVTYSMMVIKSNYGHVFATYSHRFLHYQDTFVDDQIDDSIHGFLMRKNYESSPRIVGRSAKVHVFPNEFDGDGVDDLDEVFQSGMQGENDWPGNEDILKWETQPNCIDIAQLELHEFVTVPAEPFEF